MIFQGPFQAGLLNTAIKSLLSFRSWAGSSSTCWPFSHWPRLATPIPAPGFADSSPPLPAGQEICLREIPGRLRRAESHQGALGAGDRAAEGAPAPGHGGPAGEGIAGQQRQRVTVSAGELPRPPPRARVAGRFLLLPSFFFFLILSPSLSLQVCSSFVYLFLFLICSVPHSWGGGG